MSDETDKKIARSLASLLTETFQALPLKLDLSRPFPISEALRAKERFDAHVVVFPVRILRVYGKGANAIVFKVEDAHQKTYAMRVGVAQTQRQFDIQQKLAAVDAAPEIWYIGRVLQQPDLEVIVMDSIYNALSHYFRSGPNVALVADALFCLLDKKALLNILHGDMHLKNIVILKDKQSLGFIDFEFSMELPANADTLVVLDFIPLISHVSHLDPQLLQQMLAYYKDRYQMTIQPRTIHTSKIGGYSYGRLTSYVADKEVYESVAGITFQGSATSFARQELLHQFPSFKMPEIVP